MDESDMITKKHLNARILRSPWSEYPLPPLHRACRDGDMQSLIYLVTQGDRLEVFRSINEQDRFLLWTPAHWASYFGKLDCLRKLVSSGLNIDVVDGRFNQTPAQLAAFAGHANVLLWLLQCGASTDKLDNLGENAAHKAVRSGSVECLSLLQAYGAPMNALNNRNQTPYEVAASLGLEQCGMLLRPFAMNPSASKQRSLKRSLEDDMCCDEVKRQRNGKVQYSGHVEMISPDCQQQNGISLQNEHPECSLNGNSEINHYYFANEVSDMHHNGFSNGSDNQSSLLLHNGFVNGDTDMIETDVVDRNDGEVNDISHTPNVDGVDEDIRKEYLQHPHFTQRPRCVALCGHLV